jgi:hypothetical protein
MTQVPIAPPPPSQDPILGKWLYLLWRRLTQAGQILWGTIDTSGSNLTDIATRNHVDLQNHNTTDYTHLTAANHTDLTDGGETSLHYHPYSMTKNSNAGTLTIPSGFQLIVYDSFDNTGTLDVIGELVII